MEKGSLIMCGHLLISCDLVAGPLERNCDSVCLFTLGILVRHREALHAAVHGGHEQSNTT